MAVIRSRGKRNALVVNATRNVGASMATQTNESIKGLIVRFNGDCARLTGTTEDKLGTTWYFATFTEGHRKGETIVVTDERVQFATRN